MKLLEELTSWISIGIASLLQTKKDYLQPLFQNLFMKNSFRVFIPVFLLAFLFSCSYQKPGSNDYFVKVEGKTIRKKTKAFTAAHVSKDTAYLNGIFTKDARVLAPNMDVVTGKKAISQLNEEWVNFGIHEFEENSTATYGGGDFIVDEGNYFMTYGPDTVVDKGKYINVWKKVNGNWKIYSNIWNSSADRKEDTASSND